MNTVEKKDQTPATSRGEENVERERLRTLGAAFIALGLVACKKEETKPQAKVEDVLETDRCGCMGRPGTGTGTGGGGLPAPTPTPSPNPTPTPTPTPSPNPTPSPTPTPTPTPTPAPVAGRAFTFLGPDIASLTVAGGMMFTPTQLMANGQAIRVWGFDSSAGGFNGDRVAPGPVIELTEGQTAAITLTSMMPHTIHFHGLDVDQQNDGFPSTSSAVGARTAFGSTHTYSFVAPHAGTYMYHCHVDTVLHMEMGMSGTIIVRPPDGNPNQAWQGGPVFEQEYVWHLHTFDSTWHTQSRSGAGTVRYRPNYFMINGRDGANTTADAATAVSAATGTPVLIRVVNIGYQPALVSLGGLTFEVIASDGRPLPRPIRADSFKVAPGERYDLLFTMPSGAARTATVDYLNIRGTAVLGTATTTVTPSL